MVPNTEQTSNRSNVSDHTPTGTRVALWWLRHYESIIHFWTGFSWVWVVGILLSAIAGHLDLGHALSIIILVGIIANTGMYLGIRTLASYLKCLKDGRQKEEAHELMAEIIKKRMLHVG